MFPCDLIKTQLQAETSTTDATCVCNDGFFGDGEVCEPWRQLCATVEGCEASGKQLCAQADLSAATVADSRADCEAVGSGSQCQYHEMVLATSERCRATDSQIADDVTLCRSLGLLL